MHSQAWPSAIFLLLTGCAPDLSGLTSATNERDAGTAGSAALGGSQPVGGTAANGGTEVQAELGGTASGAYGGASSASGAAPPIPEVGGGGTGSGGSSGDPPCVVSGAEVCNERDDDCNGIVDDGCPGGISTTFDKDLELIGDSPGGTAFNDDCKDGEVLSGVTAATGAFLSQIQGVCSSLTVARAADAEGGYRISLVSPRPLAAHPETTGDTATSLACPQDEALVGMRIAQQHVTLEGGTVTAVTTRLWLTCAKLVMVTAQGNQSVTWQGAKETSPVSGSMADGTAWFAESKAPEGSVGSRLLGTSGAWVDRIGFGVSRLGVVLR
jgi:hypothetical protein